MRPQTVATLLLGLALVTGCKRLGDHLPYRLYKIGSSSMEPTVYAGETIYVDQAWYQYHPIADGDLVVFHHHDFVLLKRVSALPGETIEGRDGKLYRNGVALAEPYAHYSPGNAIPEDTFAVRKVPAGQIFVTGDDRDRSLDSRADEYGPVLLTQVFGRAVSVYQSKRPGRTGHQF